MATFDQQVKENIARAEAKAKENNMSLMDWQKAPVPVKTPAIVSSSSVITNKNTNTALNTAGNALTGPTNKTNTNPPDGSYYEGGKLVTPTDKGYKAPSTTKTELDSVINPILQQAIDESKASKRALEMTYNAALATKNAKYDSLHKQLTDSFNKSIDVATDSAVALNPYSSSRGATTATNFKQKITDNYNQAAVELQRQADLAQQELEAGNYAAYVEIQNSLDKTIADTISSTNSMLLDMKKSAEQTRQFEATFEMNEKRYAQDDFQKYIDTLSGSPELQSDINQYFQTGEVTEGIMPIIKKGFESGLSPNESLGIMTYQSDKVRQQEALEKYRVDQLTISQQRANQSQERIAMQQSQMMTIQGLQGIQQGMLQQGIKPGSAEYAQGMASATAGSTKALPYAAVQEFTGIGSFVTQLDSLKSKIESVNKNSPLGNILYSKLPVNIQSLNNEQLAQLNAEIGTIVGNAATSVFGVKGVPSDFDTKQIIGGLPTGGAGTEQLRTALYNNIVGFVTNRANQKLQNEAANGYNVSGYAPIIQDLNDKTKSLKITNDKVLGELTSKYPGLIGLPQQ